MVAAVRLMGAQGVLTGISPATAMTIVGRGIDLTAINTRSTLEQGLKLAIFLVARRAAE